MTTNQVSPEGTTYDAGTPAARAGRADRVDRPTAPLPGGDPGGHRTAGIAVAVLAVAAVIVGLAVPDRATGAGMDGMSMTHYMGLLSVNQPWNLLLFMALPVVLAETLAITELVILFAASSGRRASGWVLGLNRWAGILAGPVMLGILVHLLRHAVLPLTLSGGWRGTADVIAVGFYLLGAVPMMGISLVEAGVIGGSPRTALKWHVGFVAAFLVVSHIAMIFGMLDPVVFGWTDPASAPMPGMTHEMPGGEQMPGMHH